VLCEKPLALSLEECDRIARARDTSGRVLQVGTMKRFDPAYLRLLELLPESAGDVRYLSVEVRDPGHLPFVAHLPMTLASDLAPELVSELRTRMAARVREASLALERTRVLSPVDGVVARKSAQVGQRVAAGTPLMSIVELDDLWVDANFKEVQLQHMRIGQPVELKSDLYGSDVVYHGRVQGFSPGTGAAFALLPAQNASGNWIKIVQRVPVRIALEARELDAHPLRIGLSMHVRVDEHDRSGPVLTPPATRVAASVPPRDVRDAQADALIARVITSNSVR